MGRQQIEDEKRNKKVMFTVTQTTFANLSDLSHINKMSIAGYLSTLINQDAEENTERLKIFRELNNNAQMKGQ